MTKSNVYRAELRSLNNWEPFLLAHSGLPGPRGNLELVQAVADEGTEEQFQRWILLSPREAPENTPMVFLVVCGVVGLGRLLATGDSDVLPLLRQHASDPRWRVREAVAMALQRLGAADMNALLTQMQTWCTGGYLEQRAAIAALCEPALLRRQEHTLTVLSILDRVTQSVASAPVGRNEDHRILRQALGYCWSVAVVASPDDGKSIFSKWLTSDNPDVRWVMRQNLGKKRLTRMDALWTKGALAQVAAHR